MRILFAGTPEIAVPSLQRIAQAHEVCAVLTNPPRPAGRARREAAPAVQRAAIALGLPLLQPERLDAAVRAQVRELAPELLVVVAYGRLFGPRFLALFPRGGVNLHPSLLPKYRGPSPIQAALLAGESETGVSVQWLAAEMDAGDILAQRRVPIGENETAVELAARLALVGAEVLAEVLERLEKGEMQAIPQDPTQATYSALVRKSDGLVPWTDSARAIYNRYRAFQPWPGLYTTYNGQQLHIRGCSPAADSDSRSAELPGKVLAMDSGGGLLVQTGEGLLRITALQLQQRKAMDARSFLNGHPEILGAVLGGR